MAIARTDGFVDPCIPALGGKPPSGTDWVHEIKHDGHRLIVRRDGPTVRLFTRRGYDWTERYPAIAGAAAKLRARSFTLDGEAVVCGTDGVAVFNALHRPRRASDAILFAFDLIELDGEDFRLLPLSKRKTRLARLISRVAPGIELTRIPMPMALQCSGTPARWAWRASCRSGRPRPIAPGLLGIGSR
jgi:bifunctional non-homologous end joining protein LigD